MAGRHALLVYLLAVLCGFVLLAVASIAIGAVVVDLLVPIGGVDAADESVVKDLVSIRDGTLTDISAIASTAAGGVVLPAIAAVAAVVFVALRRWALAAFLAVGLSIESASYRLTSIVNPRERPDVMRLDGYPADASYPSGHVAAAIVVYGGLALLIGSRISNRWARAGLVVAAVAIVTIVGASRMYRGMHHPIDLAAGVGIGCAALAVMVGASRAATAAAARRAERRVALREATT
jgi:membrane-associated phospholipid phosphatase